MCASVCVCGWVGVRLCLPVRKSDYVNKNRSVRELLSGEIKCNIILVVVDFGFGLPPHFACCPLTLRIRPVLPNSSMHVCVRLSVLSTAGKFLWTLWSGLLHFSSLFTLHGVAIKYSGFYL